MVKCWPPELECSIRINEKLVEQETADEVVSRIDKLQPESQRLWGRMDVAQMMAHFHNDGYSLGKAESAAYVYIERKCAGFSNLILPPIPPALPKARRDGCGPIPRDCSPVS